MKTYEKIFLDPMDNDQLQKAAKEMENLLTNLIDSIQKNKDKNLN